MVIMGKIKKIDNQKENDWGRYTLDVAGQKMLAVGVLPGAGLGMTVELEGNEVTNQYGHQFKITKVIKTQEDELEGARKFLTGGYIKGIKETKGAALLEKFGKEAPYLFDTPEGQAKIRTVRGFGGKTLAKMMDSFNENKKYRDIVMFLNGMVTKNQVENIYNKYEDKAIRVLKRNPYQIQLDLDGFGFLKTDKIALSSGVKPDSIYRITAAIKYVIENAESAGGHCFLLVDQIRSEIMPLLAPMPKFEDISEKVAENAVEKWPESKERLIKAYDPSSDTLETLAQTIETRRLIAERVSDALRIGVEDGYFVNDGGKIYTQKMYELEINCAKLVAKMCKAKPVRTISQEKVEEAIKRVEERKTADLHANGLTFDFVATQEQRDAVYLGTMNRISIISGGPGRGKTAISEMIAEAFLSCGRWYSKEDIIMLAPTGRAAQRITESTGYDAMTAQRAVMALRTGKESLPSKKLILCDESSMVDIYLFYDILKFARDCNLIFVGDIYQIASVGPGKVLKDLIDCGEIPCILLTQGHRNSGSIAHNSELINAGITIDRYEYDEHFVYIPATSENIFDAMIDDYKKKICQYGIKNVMLCSAMKERGAVCVSKLNTRLQQDLTAGQKEARFGNKLFRVGDRVMHTHNDYDFTIKRNGVIEKGVFNGERGSVAKISYNYEYETYILTVLFDDGSIANYSKNSVDSLTLAYATTLHKCQGSEADCMMMAYTYGDYILLNRALFYTGETRAKKEFRFYGEEKWKYGEMLSAFDIAVGKADDNNRNTSLASRIGEEVEALANENAS